MTSGRRCHILAMTDPDAKCDDRPKRSEGAPQLSSHDRPGATTTLGSPAMFMPRPASPRSGFLVHTAGSPPRIPTVSTHWS